MNYSAKDTLPHGRIGSLLLKPFIKAQDLRSDERGNVLLLTGMMAFLVAIFALLGMDTSQAIYNRIIAQNAVDSAADAAALWHARGCNMVQNLNNYHYEANAFFAKTESTALNSCSLAALLKIGEELNIPYFSAICKGARILVCVGCKSAPYWDDAQNATAFAILKEQELITATIPFLALAAANDAAQGSGADELMTSASTWLDQWAAPIGLPLPEGGLSGIGSTLRSILGTFGLTVYALPLDPKSLKLGVRQTVGSGRPWQFGPCPGEQWAGRMACQLRDPRLNLGPEEQYERKWGWRQDRYYVGQPGFMTWIAGKTNQTELAGLGFLRWLNPKPTPPEEITYWMNQSGLPMYKERAMASSSLVIPAYIALASSQVDGKPGTKWKGVVAHDAPNSYPYLIPVQIPTAKPVAGNSIGILH